MSEPTQRQQLSLWFTRWAEGTLPPDQLALLEETLKGSEEARRLWFQFADVEVGIGDWVEVQKHLAESSLPATMFSTAPSGKPPRRGWTVRVAWGVAACVLCGLSVFLAWKAAAPSDPSADGVAVVSHSLDAVWTDPSESRAVGANLSPGPLRLGQGALMLDFYSGAQLILEGPAEIKLVSALEVELVSGKINAHIPPQASGFTVTAPGLRLVDRGTDFGVIVGRQEAEVHVFKGKVEVDQPNSANPQRILQDGQGLKVRDDECKEIVPDPQAFLSQAEILEREAEKAQLQRGAWREAARLLSQDPSAVLHYRMEEKDAPALIVNAVPGAREATNGRLIGCEWVAGRWPLKRALQFRGEEDRVRLRIDEPLKQVTFLAWVRVRGLRPGLCSILSADDEKAGSLHWELTDTGRLRLSIARDLGRTRADWEAVNREPFVKQDRLGQWVFLATTFDGSKVRHFGNGEPIGSGAAFTPPALWVGSADLGNCKGKNIRCFPGAIDEFAIVGRTLSVEELREYYNQGKP